MSTFKKVICAILVIASIFLLASCGKKKVVTVELEDKVLCEAQLIENHVSFDNSSVTIDLPPNAAITKIYAYIIEGADTFERGEIAISDDEFLNFEFLYYFDKDPATSSGSFETAFIQPVCVGPEGAQIKLTAIGAGPVNAGLILNVAYCPDYCEE